MTAYPDPLMPMPPVAGTVPEVMAQRISPGLRRQRWALNTAPAGAMARAIHLGSGRGTVVHSLGETALRAPDVIWLPSGCARELLVEAGSVGVNVGVSDALLAQVVGARDGAGSLRQVSTRLCVVTPPDGALRDELLRSLLALEAEARGAAGGLRPYLAAHLTIALIALWRLGSQEHELSQSLQTSPGRLRLLRFRHLVEAQFRSRWPMTRYAAELGLSLDALHDLCVRTLGRTPTSLVHERVVGEACSLLAHTDSLVERVASDLGFDSVSHFSRLFKRRTGVSPSHWRRRVQQAAPAGGGRTIEGYGDWP